MSSLNGRGLAKQCWVHNIASPHALLQGPHQAPHRRRLGQRQRELRRPRDVPAWPCTPLTCTCVPLAAHPYYF